MNKKIIYIIWFSFINIMFLLICAFTHQWKNILTVDKVEVEGEYILTEKEIVNLCEIQIGNSIYEVSLDSIRNKLLKQEYIKDVTITRKYLNAISIFIVERKPIASLMFNKVWYIDSDGVLLPKIPTKVILDLPVISGMNCENKNPTNMNLTDLQDAIIILSKTLTVDEELFYLISEINLNDGNDIIIYSSDYGVPIKVGRGDYGKKLILLSAFWKQFVAKRGAENLKSVDVRFNDQIVAVWKDENLNKAKDKLI